MKAPKKERGLIIFGLLVVIIALAALAAYQMTGHMGIEDRYNQAVGLPVNGDENGDSFFGFSVEGNPVLYIVVLSILLAVCYILYRRFLVKTD